MYTPLLPGFLGGADPSGSPMFCHLHTYYLLSHFHRGGGGGGGIKGGNVTKIFL